MVRRIALCGWLSLHVGIRLFRKCDRPVCLVGLGVCALLLCRHSVFLFDVHVDCDDLGHGGIPGCEIFGATWSQVCSLFESQRPLAFS